MDEPPPRLPPDGSAASRPKRTLTAEERTQLVRIQERPDGRGWTLDQRAWIFLGAIGLILGGAAESATGASVSVGLCAVLFYLAGIYHRLRR
jgi:hypothetical protein